jgi:hypothetical protein
MKNEMKVTMTFEQFTLMRDALIAGESAADSIVRSNTTKDGVANVMATYNTEISGKIHTALEATRWSNVTFS